MNIIRALAAAAVLFAPTAALADSLTLQNAVKEALTANERSLKAPLRVEAAEGGVARARDAFFPTLVLGSQLTVTPGKATTTNGTVTLTQPIVAPSAIPLYSQAKHTLESERWGAFNDKRQLAFDTAKAFFQTLSAERVLLAAQRRLDTAKANLEYAQARVQAQLASTNDVTRATVDMASAQTAVVNAGANVTRAYLTLGFLMGRAIAPGLAPPDDITKLALAFEPTKHDLELAIERRPDVKSAHEHTVSLEEFAKEPLYRLIPSVNAVASVKADPNPLPGAKYVDESAGLSLNWAIFDAGFRYADRKTRLAQAKSASLDEQLLRRSVETDIAGALTTLRAARDALRIADDAVAASQKNVEETAILYKQGLAKAIEMTDANLSRFDAEVTRESAKVAVQQAYLDLRQALGFGALDDETSGKK